MASFFGNRPSYVTASWANQRIYPRTEPTFSQPAPSPVRRTTSAASGSESTSNFPPVARTRSSPGSPPPTTTNTAPAEGAQRPAQPPPLYFPGANRQRSLSQSNDAPLAENLIPSINAASTRLSIVPWQHHPIPLLTKESSVGDKVKKWLRFPEMWKCFAQENEVLWDGWPAEFGGRPFVAPTQRQQKPDEEQGEGESRLSRFSSRRSGASRADSGIVLPRMSSSELGRRGEAGGGTIDRQHPLEALYRKRIAELNKLISEGLVLTRGWLAMTELMWMTWFVALVVALAQGQGKQTGFLKGVEIGLVCVIILSALAINGIRMRRWALAEHLRKRTRDWSPLPITSSTNTELMRNYLDGDADPREVAAQQGHKDRPVLRWRLREIEGGYWIAYRPIIRCELITPATRSNPQMMLNPNESIVANGDPVREPASAIGELPPGYEEQAVEVPPRPSSVGQEGSHGQLGQL
ncbi:hypothetical protein JCM3766R1_005017 [Sporobolomyces carnicolor]